MAVEIQRELVMFRNRPDRPEYIGHRFRPYLTGKVLDVGCDQAVIRGIIGSNHYVGAGMTPEANVKINLEAAERLPFQDREFGTVMCLDTLEHLNNLYAMCDELFRLANEHVVISLPNCWVAARRSLAKGGGSIWQYGLPAAAPPDRHKWFFSTEEACAFLEAQQQLRQGWTIVEMVALENRRPLINRFWRRVKYPSRKRYLNLYPHTVVCVYRRNSAP